MPVYKTARFAVRAEAMDSCTQAIQKFVDYVNATEPGTWLYVSLQDAEDKTRFLHVMIFKDEAAENVHRNSDAVRRFTEALSPGLAEPVTLTAFSPIASTETARLAAR